MVPMDGQGDQQIGFWSLKVPAGKKATYKVVSNPFHFELVHATTVALGENARDGAHVIKIDTADQLAVLCTLDKKVGYQASVDFAFGIDATFHNSGATDVYLTGYRTLSVADDGDDDYEEDEDEDEDEDGESSDEDDEDVPDGVPLTHEPHGKGKANGVKQQEQRDEESPDDEDEDESEDEDEDEESDEQHKPMGKQKAPPAKLLGKDFPRASGEGELPELNSDDIIGEVASDDEMEDADEDESEDESEDEDEDEEDSEPEEPTPKPAAKQATKAGDKRPAAATPQPAAAKKHKLEAAPATAPPKVQQAKADKQQQGAAGGSAAEKDYEAALVKFLRGEGTAVKLATVGSKVRRPPGVVKMKPFLLARPNLFKVDEQNDTIGLA